jgi:UDP-N-acetyl-D-galactosamine dehydrogenase
MIQDDIKVKGADVLVLGITFKENCPDVRNTKVVDVISSLEEFGVNITIFDPWADEDEVFNEYKVKSVKKIPAKKFDTIILAVAHDEFKQIDFVKIRKDNSVVYDVKNVLPTKDRNKGL